VDLILIAMAAHIVLTGALS